MTATLGVTPRNPYDVAADVLDPPPPMGPIQWVQKRRKAHVVSYQGRILESVRNNRRTAVKTCHTVGKSFTAANVVCWFLDSYPPGEAFALTTAPTGAQVKAILWREINNAHAAAGLMGRTNLTEWYVGQQLVAMGRKPSDYSPTSFQGIHARRVLVVIDEACGVPKGLWAAIDSLISNEDSRILAIGNPDDPGSHFKTICDPGSGWEVIQVSAFDTPAFTGESCPDEVKAQLVSPVWVEEKRKDWGEDSPLWLSKVMGEFPEDSETTVVKLSQARACMAEVDYAPNDPRLFPVELGVDVGAGGDQSVIRERRGPLAGRVWRSRHKDAMKLVGEIQHAVRETGATRLKIDVIGIGWGIAGRLKELSMEHGNPMTGVEVVEVNVGEASTEPEKYVRLRDQIWWEVGRLSCQEGTWDLSGLDDDTLGELVTPEWTLDSRGRIKVEPKADTIKRVGHSPDSADSLLLAFYSPPPGKSKRLIQW